MGRPRHAHPPCHILLLILTLFVAYCCSWWPSCLYKKAICYLAGLFGGGLGKMTIGNVERPVGRMKCFRKRSPTPFSALFKSFIGKSCHLGPASIENSITAASLVSYTIFCTCSIYGLAVWLDGDDFKLFEPFLYMIPRGRCDFSDDCRRLYCCLPYGQAL